MPAFQIPKSSRGRFAQSAESKPGMTIVVPQPIIDAEQNQIMQMILDARVQQLVIHLRRGGVKHLNMNEKLKKGEYRGFTPLHVGVIRGTSSIVSALLELAGADANVKAVSTDKKAASKGETALHLAAAKGDVGMTRALHTAAPP